MTCLVRKQWAIAVVGGAPVQFGTGTLFPTSTPPMAHWEKGRQVGRDAYADCGHWLCFSSEAVPNPFPISPGLLPHRMASRGALRTLRGRCFAAAMMHLNANLPATSFGVPPAQVVEVGLEVEI